MADELWIQHAIKKPGALTAQAKRAGKTVAEFIREPHSNPTTKRRVALAKALRRMRSHK